jgi:hypothetical protein
MFGGMFDAFGGKMYGCEGYGVGGGSFKILCSMRSFVCWGGDNKGDGVVEGIDTSCFGIGF